jgi:hypothetical protein
MPQLIQDISEHRGVQTLSDQIDLSTRVQSATDNVDHWQW